MVLPLYPTRTIQTGNHGTDHLSNGREDFSSLPCDFRHEETDTQEKAGKAHTGTARECYDRISSSNGSVNKRNVKAAAGQRINSLQAWFHEMIKNKADHIQVATNKSQSTQMVARDFQEKPNIKGGSRTNIGKLQYYWALLDFYKEAWGNWACFVPKRNHQRDFAR